MKLHAKSKNGLGIKIFVGFYILMGLTPSLSHYFAPRPEATASESQFLPVGSEWFLEQLPRYDLYPITTFLHLIPALMFMLLLGFQLSRSLREKRPKLHRINGRLLSLLAVSFALSGIIIGIQFPFGGMTERITSSLLTIMFLYSLYKGVSYARGQNFKQHRLWMLRMVAISFTPITMRLIMIPIGFLQLVEMTSIFGLLMTISSVINLIVLELFILKKTTEIKKPTSQLQPTELANQ